MSQMNNGQNPQGGNEVFLAFRLCACQIVIAICAYHAWTATDTPFTLEDLHCLRDWEVGCFLLDASRPLYMPDSNVCCTCLAKLVR